MEPTPYIRVKSRTESHASSSTSELSLLSPHCFAPGQIAMRGPYPLSMRRVMSSAKAFTTRPGFRAAERPLKGSSGSSALPRATHAQVTSTSAAKGDLARLGVPSLPFACRLRDAGEVKHAEVFTEGGKGGARSKGCGIVEYFDARDANRAIQTLTDTELMGRLIFVREDRED